MMEKHLINVLIDIKEIVKIYILHSSVVLIRY